MLKRWDTFAKLTLRIDLMRVLTWCGWDIQCAYMACDRHGGCFWFWGHLCWSFGLFSLGPFQLNIAGSKLGRCSQKIPVELLTNCFRCDNDWLLRCQRRQIRAIEMRPHGGCIGWKHSGHSGPGLICLEAAGADCWHQHSSSHQHLLLDISHVQVILLICLSQALVPDLLWNVFHTAHPIWVGAARAACAPFQMFQIPSRNRGVTLSCMGFLARREFQALCGRLHRSACAGRYLLLASSKRMAPGFLIGVLEWGLLELAFKGFATKCYSQGSLV
jgi:hypothetical protein